jgi:hypothetical protein
MAIDKTEIIAELMQVSEEDDTSLVSFYVDNAEEIILNQLYPFDENWSGDTEVTVPTRYKNLWKRMALYLLEKAGVDGETLHVENGMHRHYGSSDVPVELLRQILPKAVMI